MKPEPWPALCPHHAGIYATRDEARRHRVPHPGQGRRALIAEAQRISDQCCRRLLGLPPRWRP